MNQLDSQQKYLRPVYIFIGIIVIAGIIVIITEYDQITKAVQVAEWQALIGAIFFTIVAYVSMSLSFASVCRLFRIKMGIFDLTIVGFVTNTLNRIITAGGVAGLSLRLVVMDRSGVAMRDTIAASMMHYYLGTIDMMIMLPIGIIYLINNTDVSITVERFLQVFTGILIFLVIIATLIIFNPDWRRKILDLTYQVTLKISKRDLKTTFSQFDKTLTRRIKFMKYKPVRLFLAILFTWIEWFASVYTLSYCLYAFGEKQSFGIVMTGYVIGITLGLASMIPGGLGVQEGAMTFVFHLLGVPFGQAVLATILFRGIYFFLPYLISLLFYRPMFRTPQSATGG